MNERIKQLAEQAKAFIVEPEQVKIGEVSEVSFDKYSDLEKFAELIIEECCVALHPMLRDMISRGQGVDLIKKHFGVKE